MSASSFSLNFPREEGLVYKGVGKITAGHWEVATLGSPPLSSGTPRKARSTQDWPARGREDTHPWAQPRHQESPWVSPPLLPGEHHRGEQPLSQPARLPSVRGGAAPGTCFPRAAQGRAPETPRLPRGPGTHPPLSSGSRESRSPRVAAGGWMRPSSGRERPSGRGGRGPWDRTPGSPTGTDAPLGLSARGGPCAGWRFWCLCRAGGSGEDPAPPCVGGRWETRITT